MPAEQSRINDRVWCDLYGNGKPGLIDEHAKIQADLYGGDGEEGIKSMLKRLVDKPKNTMIKVRDAFYIILALIAIARYVFDFIGK